MKTQGRSGDEAREKYRILRVSTHGHLKNHRIIGDGRSYSEIGAYLGEYGSKNIGDKVTNLLLVCSW